MSGGGRRASGPCPLQIGDDHGVVRGGFESTIEIYLEAIEGKLARGEEVVEVSARASPEGVGSNQ